MGQQQMQQTLDRLKQAMDDMRQANNANAAGTPQGEAQARKAAERLKEATDMLAGMRGQQSASQLDGLTKQAEDLVRKQQDFEGQMRRAYGNERGVTREQAEQLARQKDEEAKELKNLEAGMQQAVRDLQSTQRGASTKIREALGEMQQQELSRDMQRNAEWIRRGMGQYAVVSESQITAGLSEVRDQLRQAQQAMGKGNDGKGGQQNDQATERALRQVEQYRRQLEQMSAQQGQQGRPQAGQQPGGQQNGQGKQGQQQPGGGQQSAQQQSNQQGGKSGQGQGKQGQEGQGQGQGKQGEGQGQGQGQPGQQPGQGQGQGQPGGQQSGQGGGQQAGGQYGGQVGGDRNGGAWNGGGNGNGNRWLDGPVRPADIQQTYRETLQSLQQLQQEYRDDPNAAREVQGLIRGLREFDPFAAGNDMLLGQRIQAALAGVEQVEMELRKKVEITTGNGSVRSAGGEKVPEGFDKQVAEYFRKLSKGNK
jgi:hypothetical protein